MVTVNEALNIIEQHMPKWGRTFSNLAESGLSTEVLRADRDYPPFDRVMMDGIAVSWRAFFEGQRHFRIAGIVAAGSSKTTLTAPDQCLEVMTGASLPEQAELVIPYEDLNIENGSAFVINDVRRILFENVHRKGSDAKAGECLLPSRSELNGPHWGIAASLGISRIETEKMPRIGVISTGDELVDVDATPLDHQIRRSNSYALKASLLRHGYGDVELFHLRDSEDEIEAHYLANREQFDVLIYSGGVSKGKFDYLPACWKRLGVTEHLHGIRQRPGKPLWFGVDAKHATAVFGLPGNPVSSLVCLHRYFLSRKKIFAALSQDLTFEKDLTYFVPVKLEYTESAQLVAHPLEMKNSGEFTALLDSDGFLELPREQTVFSTGDSFQFHPWSPM